MALWLKVCTIGTVGGRFGTPPLGMCGMWAVGKPSGCWISDWLHVPETSGTGISGCAHLAIVDTHKDNWSFPGWLYNQLINCAVCVSLYLIRIPAMYKLLKTRRLHHFTLHSHFLIIYISWLPNVLSLTYINDPNSCFSKLIIRPYMQGKPEAITYYFCQWWQNMPDHLIVWLKFNRSGKIF